MPNLHIRTHLASRLVKVLLHDRLLLGLIAVFVLLAGFAPHRILTVPDLIDWPTIAALSGLLALTKGLELSGALRWLASHVAARMPNQTALALAMVLMAALLSMLLTNDVALFVVVPITIVLARKTGIQPTRLIVFEALAVNAGSALTPIGNPQNLYLWQVSKVGFGAFVAHMLPLVLILMGLLLIVTVMSFPKLPITNAPAASDGPIDRVQCALALALFIPFLYATNMGQAIPAAAAVMVIFACLRWRTVARLDWGLLVTFILMFVDLGLVAGLPVVAHGFETLKLEVRSHLYWTSIGASQIISNVPATIAIVRYSQDWRTLSYGVNIGGFGLLIGSLANLIALRMTGDKRGWIVFHAYALPFLLVGAAIGYLLLFA